jgi:hypothetical protein
MSRTRGRQDSDLGYADGQFFIQAPGAAKTASGLYSLALGNSATDTLVFPLEKIVFRYGLQDWTQEQFGSTRAGGSQGLPVNGFTTLTTASIAVGTSVSIPVLNSADFVVGRTLQVDVLGTSEYPTITSIPDATHIVVSAITASHASGSVVSQNVFTTPAGVTGPPPFTGTTSLTPVTSPRPKGIKIRQIYPWFTVTGLALTTNTIGLTKTVAANATAPVVTSLLTNAANGLPTAVQATPYLTPIQLPSANINYQTTKFASYNIEWDISTGTTGTAAVYGIFVDVEFNWS